MSLRTRTSPLTCHDSKGREYKAVRVSSFNPGSDDDVTWRLVEQNQEDLKPTLELESAVDPETGKDCFRCPELEGQLIFPK